VDLLFNVQKKLREGKTVRPGGLLRLRHRSPPEAFSFESFASPFCVMSPYLTFLA
jgi:hypothetical protein